MKPITAFAPFRLTTPELYKWCGRVAKKGTAATEVIKHFMARDPASHAWGSLGILEAFEGSGPVHALDGAGYLIMYQLNQRILPGPVRDEKLRDRIAALVEKEDRDPTKQEYAQLRDQVESELLPQAFIRRTHIPVLVFKERILICTASAKKHEDISYHLAQMLATRGVDCAITLTWTMEDIKPLLMKTALGDAMYAESERHFEAANAAVFKGSDKRSMRIKDRDVAHKEVQHVLINGSYEVTELRLNYKTEDGDDLLTCTLTDKLVVKGIKLAQTTELKTAEDAHATMYLFARELHSLTEDIISALGGDAEDADDEEEEL